MALKWRDDKGRRTAYAKEYEKKNRAKLSAQKREWRHEKRAKELGIPLEDFLDRFYPYDSDLAKLDAAAASLDRERSLEMGQLTAGVYAYRQGSDPETHCSFAPVEIK